MEMAWYIPILIFCARICDVSIGTVRTMMVIAGYRYSSALLGFFEVIIWVLAVGGALAFLTNPFALAGYAGGFACGVVVGMWLEDRIALGYRLVRVISPKTDFRLGHALRERGYRVTSVEGWGRTGPVEIEFLVVRRRVLPKLREHLVELAPSAFVTVERVDHAAGPGLTESRFSRRAWDRLVPVRK